MRLCYLIGYPVGHSMSAVMHNAAFRQLGLDLRFEAAEVRPEELRAFVAARLRASEVRGSSITIPHKVAVIQHLDEIDASARRVGAVNTIVNDGGRLRGHNTDILGASRALEEAFGDLAGCRAVLIGSGGAARAIGHHLSTVAGDLVILNRTPSKALELSEILAGNPARKAEIRYGPLDEGGLKGALAEADLLVNATPVGMSPNTEETPVGRGLLRSGLMVFDTVYNPPVTRLLREAAAAGARTLGGVGMLVYQGAEAFRLWTGREAPVEVMRRAVEEALGVRGG